MKHDLSDAAVRERAIRQFRAWLKLWRAKVHRKKVNEQAYAQIIIAAECAIQALGADPDDTTS